MMAHRRQLICNIYFYENFVVVCWLKLKITTMRWSSPARELCQLWCCEIYIIWGFLLTWRTAECRQNKNAAKSKVTKRTHF